MNDFDRDFLDDAEQVCIEEHLRLLIPRKPAISAEALLLSQKNNSAPWSYQATPTYRLGPLLTSWVAGVAMGAVLMFAVQRTIQNHPVSESMQGSKQVASATEREFVVQPSESLVIDERTPYESFANESPGRWSRGLRDDHLTVGAHLFVRNKGLQAISLRSDRNDDNADSVHSQPSVEAEVSESSTREFLMKELLDVANQRFY